MHHFLSQQPICKLLVFILLCLFSTTLLAQPSGGPYGPQQQTYKLPEDAKNIYYVAPDGKADASGTELEAPTTLQAAMTRVVTGDAIILRGGTYRTGELQLNQAITMQPYADEQPVLKGTMVATEGVALRGNLWRIPWKRLFPAQPLGWWRREREGMHTPLHRFNNDMVFVNGRLLKSVGWEGAVDKNSYFIDYEKDQVYVAVDPAKQLVEITAWNGGLTRVTTEVHGKESDKKGPVIRGINFTQYAWRAIEIEGKKSFGPNDEPTDEPLGPADPASYGKEVIGTTLENVTISYCSRVAGYFRGDSLIIRNSRFSHTGTEGVYVIGSSDVLLENNIFGRNNVEQLTGYYPSAVKIFNQSHRVTCKNNLLLDNPHSNGIWYDVGNRDGVFINNWIQDCINGFFFEISSGALVVGNVFVNCYSGIDVLNSANVHAWHNTLINSPATFRRNNRQAGDHFGWHAATGPDVDNREGHVFANNLLLADSSYHRPLLITGQASDLCGKLSGPQLKQLDGNVYVRNAAVKAPLITWQPAANADCSSELADIAELQKIHPGYEKQGLILKGTMHDMLQSPELARYRLAAPVAGYKGVALPDEVRRLLKGEEGSTAMPGAYKVVP